MPYRIVPPAWQAVIISFIKLILKSTRMKTFLPALTLVLILSISVISSVLYLNMQYISSALLTIIWVLGITVWIGTCGVKEKEAK